MGIAGDFVLIVVAGFLGAVAARALRLPLLVGYIAAGVFVGPNTGGPTVGHIHEIELLAEIGVALLLFSLGLEISLRDLKPVGRIAAIGGPLQILTCGALGAIAAINGLGTSITEAIWFGAMVSVSSTMVVLKLMAASGMTATLASRVMIGLLVIQDLAVVPMLIILPQASQLGNALTDLSRAAITAALFLVAMVLLGTRVMPSVLARLLRWGSRELFLVAIVAAGVGVGYVSHAIGLSFALGAFVAGIVLSESEMSHQALSDVVPLRDVFGLLFFVSVGMLFDPAYLWRNPGTVAAMTTAIVFGKALLTGVIARAFGYGNTAPWIIGLGLSQIGEFSFVLARSGRSLNAISKDTYDLALTCTIVTIAISPVLSAIAPRLGRWWLSLFRTANLFDNIAPPPPGLRGHVVIAGCGRTGAAVAKVMQSAEVPLTVIELNHARFRELTDSGVPAIWGDVTRDEVQRAARVEGARVLVIAVPDANTALLAIQQARLLTAGFAGAAGARREAAVRRLTRIGVDHVVQPEFEGGIEMVRQALGRYQLSVEEIEQFTDSVRGQLYSRED